MKDNYMAHVDRLKNNLATLPNNNKQWKRISRELMQNPKPNTTIPPLMWKQQSKTDAKEKADCLAETLRDKCVLPHRVGDPHVSDAAVSMNNFIPMRRRDIIRALKGFDIITRATGSDHLPAKIFLECKKELSIPILQLMR